MAFYKLFDAFEHVVDGVTDTKEVTLPFPLAQFCATDEVAIRTVLRAGARLRTSGLVQWERQRHDRVPCEVGDRLRSAMLADAESLDGLIGLLFP